MCVCVCACEVCIADGVFLCIGAIPRVHNGFTLVYLTSSVYYGGDSLEY